MSEIQRLNKLCAERKEAKDSLKKKWKKIEEFDARRSELETIYMALLKANMVMFRYFSISRISEIQLWYIYSLSLGMVIPCLNPRIIIGFKLELSINRFVFVGTLMHFPWITKLI